MRRHVGLVNDLDVLNTIRDRKPAVFTLLHHAQYIADVGTGIDRDRSPQGQLVHGRCLWITALGQAAHYNVAVGDDLPASPLSAPRIGNAPTCMSAILAAAEVSVSSCRTHSAPMCIMSRAVAISLPV